MFFRWYCSLWILSCILWRTETRAQQSLHQGMMEKTLTMCQRLRKNQRINLRWLYKCFSLDNLYKTSFAFWNCGLMSPEYRVHNEMQSSFYLHTSKVIQNTGNFSCGIWNWWLWDLESCQWLKFRIPVMNSGIRGVKSKIHSMESSIQKCLGLPYLGRFVKLIVPLLLIFEPCSGSSSV